MKKLIEKINELLFDFQIKSRFKIDKKAQKVCMWCGKDLSNEDVSMYGIWVSGDGTTTYECHDCSEKLSKIKEKAVGDFCTKRKWGKTPSIEDCCDCYEYSPQQYYECSKLLKNVEDYFRIERQKASCELTGVIKSQFKERSKANALC